MNKTITTIIPFYNCGDILCRMLDSILSGTVLPDEILLINDGSSDNSVAIAESYAKKYSFIRCINQEHAGVSTARNLGIKYATSNWISFLDADDYIESNFYESLIGAISDDNLAGSVCGYYTEVDGISTAYVDSQKGIMDSNALLEAMFTNDNIRGFLFTRLFKTQLIKDITFSTNIRICEDLLFQTTLLTKYPKLKFACVNLPLYHYVQNSTSATTNLNLFNGAEFKYKPAFNEIKKLISKSYIDDSYNSILEYSMYRLLKEYKKGCIELLPQIRGIQSELRKNPPSHFSKRYFAYTIAPITLSKFIPL